MASSERTWLRAKDQGKGPVIYARWRTPGNPQPIERKIGKGWLVKEGEPGAKPNGKTIGKWRERKGRPEEGFLSVDMAREAVPDVLAKWTAEQARKAAQRRREEGEGLT